MATAERLHNLSTEVVHRTLLFPAQLNYGSVIVIERVSLEQSLAKFSRISIPIV